MISCAPKVITNAMNEGRMSRIHMTHEPFAVIEQDTFDRAMFSKIGEIEIKDSGMTLQCDFATVKSLAKDEALKLGGNCIIITEHREPSTWSTCHRIKADVFYIDNAQEYETEILWNSKRKLVISDFKGSTEKRPFTAATSSTFRYQLQGRPIAPKKFKVFVETYFDCHSSYFKSTEFDSSVLAHEQIHFDISELYARKFTKRIDTEVRDLKELSSKHESILDEVGRELQLKQDEYDSEVYSDRSKQKKWSSWIREELGKYELYADKAIIRK